MTIITNRIPRGVSTGGQFAATAHHEPNLNLAAKQPAAGFDYAFEKARGRELANELQKLLTVDVRESNAASGIPDLLRESYGDYYLSGEPQADRTEAIAGVEAALPNLSDERRARYLELMHFAVHTEMKHYSDTEYVVVAEHGYEQLINPDSYPEMESDPNEAQDDNAAKWALLADTAAAHAIAENQVAAHSAAA
ncbi:hypothetical protein [Arthrobacter sp. H14]|uniref:hypothetical protein n=1 Tax=Arthrobacter sp. H14 TaxID=1312959 RepID=UPI00047B2B76|nr:hypothetical protein [Arthrobacter sp. H14]